MSYALAAQTLLRTATARQTYVLGGNVDKSVDHVLCNAVLDAEKKFLAEGGTAKEAKSILKNAEAAALAKLVK